MATTDPDDKTAAKLKARIHQWEAYVLQQPPAREIEAAPLSVTITRAGGQGDNGAQEAQEASNETAQTGHRVSLVHSEDQEFTVASIPTIGYVYEEPVRPRKRSVMGGAVVLLVTLLIAVIAGVAFLVAHA